jgi:hypothetical protein
MIDWLVRSAVDPGQARAMLEGGEPALLGMGDRLAAIALEGAVVHAVLETDDLSAVRTVLREKLGGGVIHDGRHGAGQQYYALVQGHAAHVWDLNHYAKALHEGTYLSVPAPRHIRPPGSFWIVPPRFEGHLCRPSAIRELVECAIARARAGEVTR